MEARSLKSKLKSSLKKLLADGLVWQAESLAVTARIQAKQAQAPQKTPFGILEVDTATQGGLRRGCVHEFYCGSYELLGRKLPGYQALKHPFSTTCSALLAMQALNQSGSSLVIWIGKDCWPTPFILQSIENNPAIFSRCIFLDPPNRSLQLWAIEAALRSPHAGMVAFSVPKINLRVSQRFSLAARSSGALGILLSAPGRLKQLSAAHSRWQVSAAPSPSTAPRWSLELHALKGAPMPLANKWTIEMAADIKFFRQLQNNDQQTVSINILPRVVDSGSAQATAQALRGETRLACAAG